MKREIKFRVWDNLSNYYFTPSSIDFEVETLKECRNPVDGIYRKHIFKNVILEQYTGLKDRHGEEIYEGDIVKLGRSGKEHRIEWNDSGYWTCRVIPENDYHYIGRALFHMPNEFKGLEIIGNIHEEREL